MTRISRDDAATVAAPSGHNGFPDCLVWKDALWLAYRSSPRKKGGHFADPDSRIILLRSQDGVKWDAAAEFSAGMAGMAEMAGLFGSFGITGIAGNADFSDSEYGRDNRDIRDPKLFALGDKLFLLALLNRTFDPKPHMTVVTSSTDGFSWEAFQAAAPAGFLLGKPINLPSGAADLGPGHFSEMTARGPVQLLAPAHNLRTGEVRLMESTEGLTWKPGEIIRKDGDETALARLDDGCLLAATRLEKEKATAISRSAPAGIENHGKENPGTAPSTGRGPWETLLTDHNTRLDGPCLFTHGSHVYALGRRRAASSRGTAKPGAIFGKMRTALFELTPEGLVHMENFPSTGDTGYAGTALFQGRRFFCYYSTPPGSDRPWLAGMLGSTGIYSISRMKETS